MKSVGLLHDDSVDKANILNAQFQQAFSCKEELDKSQFKKRCNMNGQYETAPDINITEGVRKLLTGLNPHKAAGIASQLIGTQITTLWNTRENK